MEKYRKTTSKTRKCHLVKSGYTRYFLLQVKWFHFAKHTIDKSNTMPYFGYD